MDYYLIIIGFAIATCALLIFSFFATQKPYIDSELICIFGAKYRIKELISHFNLNKEEAKIIAKNNNLYQKYQKQMIKDLLANLEHKVDKNN